MDDETTVGKGKQRSSDTWYSNLTTKLPGRSRQDIEAYIADHTQNIEQW
jgi:hypothetical protein